MTKIVDLQATNQSPKRTLKRFTMTNHFTPLMAANANTASKTAAKVLNSHRMAIESSLAIEKMIHSKDLQNDLGCGMNTMTEQHRADVLCCHLAC